MIDNTDDLFRLILSCCKDYNKPDMHSFIALIKNGTVVVDCRKQEVYIKEYYENKSNEWVGLPIAAANRLEMLGIDLESIEV